MEENKLTVLDLFAGAGGFSLGFSQAGFKIIGAIESDKWAAETFQKNHSDAKVIVRDITLIKDNKLKELFGRPTIILGGPPCQGFSICNNNAGDPKDPRNSLFMQFIRFVKVLSPEVAIMENVPNLLKANNSKGEKVIKIIEDELKKLGYNVQSSILEAVKFGVPQIRKRLFVVASKKPLKNFFPECSYKEGKYLNLWDAISDLPEVEPRGGEEEMNYKLSKPLNEFQKEMRENSKKVWNHKSMKHSKRMIERFKQMNWGESISDVPHHLRPFKRNGNGKISKKTYDQNNRRMHPYKPCNTIAASFYASFVHPFKNRNFTAREGARIQTFPDNYKFYGKPTVVSHKLLEREGRSEEKFLGQYNQIGNAVPPRLAKAIALNIKEQL